MRWLIAAAVATTGFGCNGSKGDKSPGGGATPATAEAEKLVKKMAEGARAYYLELQIAPGSIDPSPPQFPASVGATPALGSCCKTDDRRCTPEPDDWEAPTWRALKLEPSGPFHYSYSFTRAADGRGFTARAFGDLDCDGTYSTFQLIGTAAGEDEVSLSEISRTDALE